MAASGRTGGTPSGPRPAAPPRRSAPLAVELRGITKRFPGVVANRDIELRVRRGEVHAIVGENGAGKSTLMKTLYGMHRPDEGEILLDGREVSFRSPADAIAAGIGMVHQHFMLADNFTVLENIVLGSEPTKAGRLDRAEARRRITEISDRYALDLEPDDLVEDLGVGDRQRVEIAKVLYRGARTLILDEPTAVLVPQEVDELFGNLAELKREGLTVIFISHKLDEVRRVADSITVIRRGTTVGTADPKTTTVKQLAEMMVGAELPTPRPAAPPSATASSCAWSTSPSRRHRPVAGGRREPDRARGRGRRHRRRRGQRPGRARRRDHGPASAGRLVGARATRTSPPGAPGPAARPAWASSRRTGTGRDAARRAALGEPDPGPPDAPAGGEGLLHRPRGARADTERIMRSTTSAPPDPTRWPWPSPAATSRS